MATFALHAYPNGDRGQLLSKKASGVISMGILVQKGATAGSVSPTGAAGAIMGVSIYSEFEDANNSSPYYADGEPVTIETLKSGMVLNLIAKANLAEGAICEAAADGKVQAYTSGKQTFMANEAVTAGERGEFIVL